MARGLLHDGAESMIDERHQRASEIFLQVCELEPDTRSERLRAACGTDEELLRLVEGMVSADSGKASVFDEPAAFRFSDALGDDPADDGEPRRIGQFRILRELGHGGMGVVYEAEQEHPQRTVALKLVRSVLASSTTLRRFEQEAEVLGRLNHPGIAQIYEAGVAPSQVGPQPYFAMELVRGVSLTRYADEKRLDLRERLALLEAVARAVDHAHEKGVVHRDLKPVNILVDDEGRPKILDFGIARAMDAGEEGSVVTGTGDLLGTLSYMSPEQMSGDAAELDARSDVYALGVIGYELVTGRLPHELGQVPLPEAARIVQVEEPPSPARLVRSLPGDVVTILLEALAKEKERRYASARELADDLRRFLDDEPIRAHPPSTYYFARKFARRHRTLVSALAVILVTLSGATVFSVRAALRESRAAELAEDRRAEAELQGAIAIAVNEFLNDDLLAAVRPDRAGRDVTMLEVLDAAAGRVGERFVEQPLVEAEIRYTIGDAYVALGRHELAAPFFHRTLELRREHLGDAHPDTMSAYNGLGRLMIIMGRFEDAERYFTRCLELRLEHLGPEDDHTLTSYSNLAGLYRQMGRTDEALEIYLEAGAIAERTLPPDHGVLLSLLEGRAGAYKDMRRLNDAIPLYREVLELHREKAPDHPDTARALNNLAVACMRDGRYEEARSLLVESRAAHDELFGEEHPATIASTANLGRVCDFLGDFEAAEPLLDRAVELNRDLEGPDHRATLITLQYRVDLYRHMERFEQAEEELLEAHGLAHERYGPTSPLTAGIVESLAALYDQLGEPEEASYWRDQ